MKRRLAHSAKTLWWAVAFSLALHPLILWVVDAAREEPTPRLFLGLTGEGSGTVMVSGHEPCTESCQVYALPDQTLELRAYPDEGSVFEGWSGPCGPQGPRLFSWIKKSLGSEDSAALPLEAPAAQWVETEAGRSVDTDDPLSCRVTLSSSLYVAAEFGEVPEELEVEWTESDKSLPQLAQVELPKRPDKKAPQEKKKEVEPIELAPAMPAPPEQPKVQAERLKSVEVPNQPESELEPDDARFLSDKNRDVETETRAEETNLEREVEGQSVASAESDIQSEDIGGPEDTIAKLQDNDSQNDSRGGPLRSNSQVSRAPSPSRSSESGGENGEGAKGVLSMRGVTGEGGLESELPNAGDKPGAPGPKSGNPLSRPLSFEDYARIAGADRLAKEQTQAKSKMSSRRGRFEAKMKAFRSSLENFTPEVEVGNQTALKTRADPFAVYLSGMHRKIHELWGFGFLVKMGNRFPDDSLWGKMEVVILADGTVDAVNIARSSGNGMFDAAAFSVMFDSGPFEETPKAIRSPDGKTYIHWKFHRDARQCGTFGATPFILDKKK